jgi:cytoskeletal protein CcmA (bactofilin family)
MIPMNWKHIFHRRQSHTAEWTGFIERGVRIEGRLELAGTFRIDGEVKGTIVSEQSLILAENSKAEGTIEGNLISVSGRFDGIIRARGRVDIHAKGVVTGEIHTPCLVIEPGGVFDGECHMIGASPLGKTLTIPIRSAR